MFLGRFSEHLKLRRKKIVNCENDNFGIDLENKLLFLVGPPELQPEQFGSIIVGGAEALVGLLPEVPAQPVGEGEPVLHVDRQNAVLGFPDALGSGK